MRKMPKWEHNLPFQCFLMIVRNFPFHHIFTKYATLNRQTRTIVFKHYVVVCKERALTVNLGESTKILKKLPKYMIKRLNYVKIFFPQEATTERIMRLLEFLEPLRRRVRLILECIGLDDA